MGAVLTNIIIIAILLVLVGGASLYLIKQKKKGVHCIGCPSAGTCPKRNTAQCSCNK